MASTVLNAVVPLVSALLGLALTYVINVRTRRNNFVEDLFNDAIAALVIADASQHYLKKVGQPVGMTDRDYRDLLSNMERTGLEHHARRASEAREALARVFPYEPRVRPYYLDSVLTGDRPQEIIQLLQAAKAGR